MVQCNIGSKKDKKFLGPRFIPREKIDLPGTEKVNLCAEFYSLFFFILSSFDVLSVVLISLLVESFSLFLMLFVSSFLYFEFFFVHLLYQYFSIEKLYTLFVQYEYGLFIFFKIKIPHPFNSSILLTSFSLL